MKRIVYSLIGVIALVAVAALAWYGLKDVTNNSEQAINSTQIQSANNGGAPAGQADAVQNATNQQDQAIIAPQPHLLPEATESMKMMGGGDWTNTTFNLIATLPTEPSQANLFIEPLPANLDVVTMQAIAQQWGFPTTLYQHQLGMGVEAISAYAGSVAEYPGSYVSFADEKRLTFSPQMLSYYDMRAAGPQGYDPLTAGNFSDFNQSKGIAEAFLRERGQLNFSYEIRRGYSNEVTFYRSDGAERFDRPVATVNVNKEGVVVSADLWLIPTMNLHGTTPLISAETAWNNLKANPAQYEHDFRPTIEIMLQERATYGSARHWARNLFQVGSPISINGWLTIYTPTEEGQLPRLLLNDNLPLVGSAETISGLQAVNQQGMPVHIEGTVSAEREITVTSYSMAPNQIGDLYLPGTIDLNGGAHLVVPGGLQILLPDAPADLSQGVTVNVMGTGLSQREDGVVVFNWHTMDELVQNLPMAMPAIGTSPFSAERFDFSTVRLVHRAHWPSVELQPDANGNIPTFYAPYWQFLGTDERGSEISFYLLAFDSATYPWK